MNINLDCLLLENYQKPLFSSHVNKNSGVVSYFIFYIHRDYVAKELSIQTTIENLTLELSKVILSSLNNAPAVGLEKCLVDIENLSTATNEYSMFACLVGDMNIDLLKDLSEQRRYNSIIEENRNVQLIKQPTRITDKTKRGEIRCSKGCNHRSLCHIYRHTSIGKKNRESSKRDMRCPHSEKGLAFLHGAEHLFTETWQQSQTNVSLKSSHFLADLNKLTDQNASILKPVSRKTSQPWFNNNLRNMITKRSRLYKKYSADRLAKSYNNFRLFRSRVHKAINKQKQIYYNNIFEKCLNDKSFFCVI